MFRTATTTILLFLVCVELNALPAPQDGGQTVTVGLGGQQLSGRFFLPGLTASNMFQNLPQNMLQNVFRPGLLQQMVRPLFQGSNLFGGNNNGFQGGNGLFGGNNNGFQSSSGLFGGNNNGFQSSSGLFGGNNNGFQGGSGLFGGNNNGFQGGRPGFASNLGQFASGFFNGFQNRPTASGAQSAPSPAVQSPGSSGTGFQVVPGTGFQSVPGTGQGSDSRLGSLLSGYNYQTESGFLPSLISIAAPFLGRYDPNGNNNRRFLFGK